VDLSDRSELAGARNRYTHPHPIAAVERRNFAVAIEREAELRPFQ
jgi:hypothetical protein